MHTCTSLFRSALLGSALTLFALDPALASSTLSADQKRFLALHGSQATHTANTSGRAASDATYTLLYKFLGGPSDLSGSGANVTLDDAGNIYGTTDFGAAAFDGGVFKLAPDGTETILYAFSGGADGSQPDGGVIVRPNGDIYGSTGSGGVNGNGVLFKLSAKGKLKVLHDFTSDDGGYIRGDLYRDKQGNLYGTALFGGVNGGGTVFKYAADGTFTVLHAFSDADGQFPEHGVVADEAGNLYGVTAFGGTGGNGTVYKIDTARTLTTLYSFSGGADGGFLYGKPAVDKDGNVYGSTTNGGAGAGTVFKLSPDGTLTTLYNFTGGADLGSPQGDMRLVGKNLYSTASTGGDPSCQCGGVYEITSKGKEKTLHAFIGSDGSGYSAGVTLANGLFYGAVMAGGFNQNGVVFSLTKK